MSDSHKTETYWIIEGAPLIPDAVRQIKHFKFDGQALAFDTFDEAKAFASEHGYHGHAWRVSKADLNPVDDATPVVDCGEFQEQEKTSMSKTLISTSDYSLPASETRLLARSLFEDGWIKPSDLEKLACLWSLDAPDSEVKRAVDEVFVPAWLAANTKFNIAADALAEKLGRALTETERLGIAFPHGKYYTAAQNIIQAWFESQVKSVSVLMN